MEVAAIFFFFNQQAKTVGAGVLFCFVLGLCVGVGVSFFFPMLRSVQFTLGYYLSALESP